MNPFDRIRGHFRKKREALEAQTRRLAGFRALEEAKELYGPRGDHKQALALVDKAIDYGLEAEVRGLRGSLLQEFGFHLDAIDDFNRAIELDPDDPNLFFERSVSRGAVADFDGAVSDLHEAIRLSLLENDLNRTYREAAVEMGWAGGHTALYEARIRLVRAGKIKDESLYKKSREKNSARRQRKSGC